MTTFGPYQATVVDIHDGDTFFVDIVLVANRGRRKAADVDLGFNVHQANSGLDAEYAHAVIDHAEAYVRGRVHTNGLENFWSLLKRGLNGTYVSVQPSHLFRYLDERCFTYNERHTDDLGRFELVLQAIAGKRLTYAELTGR